MSQSSDTTQTLPVIEPVPHDPDAVVITPVVPLAAAPQAAPRPPYDPVRSHVLHTHFILQKLFSDRRLPLPTVWEGHAYSTPMLDLNLAGGPEAVLAYEALFGGDLASEVVPAHTTAAGDEIGAQVYTRLATVVDGVDIVVSNWSPAPQEPEQAPVEPEAAAPVAAEEAPAAEQEPEQSGGAS